MNESFYSNSTVNNNVISFSRKNVNVAVSFYLLNVLYLEFIAIYGVSIRFLLCCSFGNLSIATFWLDFKKMRRNWLFKTLQIQEISSSFLCQNNSLSVTDRLTVMNRNLLEKYKVVLDRMIFCQKYKLHLDVVGMLKSLQVTYLKKYKINFSKN